MTGRRAVVDEDKRFGRLARSVEDQAIHVLDRHAGAKRFSGYDAGQIIGRHFSIFYPEDDRVAGAPAHALRAAEAEGRFDGEGWQMRRDGSRFWSSVITDPIRDDGGELPASPSSRAT